MKKRVGMGRKTKSKNIYFTKKTNKFLSETSITPDAFKLKDKSFLLKRKALNSLMSKLRNLFKNTNLNQCSDFFTHRRES